MVSQGSLLWILLLIRPHFTVTSNVDDDAATALAAQVSIKDNNTSLSQQSLGGLFRVSTINDMQAMWSFQAQICTGLYFPSVDCWTTGEIQTQDRNKVSLNLLALGAVWGWEHLTFAVFFSLSSGRYAYTTASKHTGDSHLSIQT